MIKFRVQGSGFRVKNIALFVILNLLVFSNVSCAQETKQEAQAPKQEAQELAYLKVENAAASGFDESPDWAPKPDAMAAVDRDMQTRWSSSYKDYEWIYFDFGKLKTISKIVIKWEQAYPTTFEILSSDDAQNWKRLVLLENQTGGTNEINFNPITARYVKVLGLKRVNEDWGISMWEFEPYGSQDKNPGDKPLSALIVAKEKTKEEKKLDELRPILSQNAIIASTGPILTTEFQKGVNYTSWDRDELGQEISDLSLIYLSGVGVGHIGLMVVNYQENAESKNIYTDPKKTISDESLAHAINTIHVLGMKVMLKPHVDLADEEARTNIIPSDEWFDSYKKFMLHYAELAQTYHVELLCIGTELSNTTIERWKHRWEDIIGAIRKVYHGPLTYAANWDEYDTVSFWNEMDYIGMDAYFPLTDKNNPPLDELVAAWNKHADAIENWLKANNLNKGVIFTEIGYDTIEGSNKQPWRVLPTLTKYAESKQEQANCLESIFLSLTKRPWFKGFYWWNYFPRSDIGALGYSLRGKPGEKILTEWFNKLK